MTEEIFGVVVVVVVGGVDGETVDVGSVVGGAGPNGGGIGSGEGEGWEVTRSDGRILIQRWDILQKMAR